MARLSEFINYLNANIGQPYVWGAQGTLLKPETYESIIAKREKDSSKHRANALSFCFRLFSAGALQLRAFDCSGLGMYWLQNLKGVSKTDLNANGMMGKCTLISKSEVKKGCWVFKRYLTGSKRAYHIGYVVDDELNVVEAQGRAYGVVKRPLSKGGWNAYGIPSFFADEITQHEKYVFTRLLKKGCKGSDVSDLQELLNKRGDSIKIDGDFGSKTLAAVKAFQKRKGLKADGVAGKKTITALGGGWGKAPDATTGGWTVSRNLKLTDPYMRGEDVKALQTALDKLGYAVGKIDGVFGERTEETVRVYQKNEKLSVDGIAGKNTIKALGGSWLE